MPHSQFNPRELQGRVNAWASSQELNSSEIGFFDLSPRTRSNIEIVLEETCRRLPHGGDHAQRKVVADALLAAARAGSPGLTQLRAIARAAFNAAVPRGQ